MKFSKFSPGFRLFCLSFVYLVSLQIRCDGQELFTNVAEASGVNHSYGSGTPSGGISMVDFDGDGLDDITLTTGSGAGLQFYRNTGTGFILMNFSLPNTDGESKQVIWVDFDNDGDKDLNITFLDSKNKLFRNDGNLTFTDITVSSGLDREFLPTYSSAWADYDRDGYLDLYITDRKTGELIQPTSNHLYRNLGNETFEETTLAAHVADSSKLPFCAYFLDYDNDGWQDIYVAQDRKKINSLFRNNRDGTFIDVSDASNSDIAIDAMSVTIGDYDNNGFSDIYVSNIPDGNKLLRNDGYGYFTEVANNSGTGFFNVGWGAQFLDVDNDTDLDLYVNGSMVGAALPSSVLYINKGDGRFESAVIPGDTATSFSNAVGDFDNDGFLDIVVNNPNPYSTFLWSNNYTSNNYLKIDLEGVLSNRDAIGARIEIYLNGMKYIRETHHGYGFLGQNSSKIHFGTGPYSTVDSVIVKWPSGHIEKFFDVPSNSTQSYLEGETNPFSPQISQSGAIVLCNGDSIVVDAGLFSSKLNYLWSDSTTNSFITIKQSGNYAVSVTNQDLGIQYQSDTLSVTVLPEQVAEVTYTKENISCLGMNDGSISLNVTGSGTYTVSWSNAMSGLVLDNLGAGNYFYTIESNAGCTTSGFITIGEPDSIGAIITQNDLANGTTVEVKASGGTPPYSYSWGHSSETGFEVFIQENGEYNVTIMDSNGCSKTEDILVDNKLITAIDYGKFINGIKIYPNPSKDDINIELIPNTREVHIVILNDINGKLVRSYKPPGQIKIINFNVNGIPPGFYIITLILKNGKKEVRKILLE